MELKLLLSGICFKPYVKHAVFISLFFGVIIICRLVSQDSRLAVSFAFAWVYSVAGVFQSQSKLVSTTID